METILSHAEEVLRQHPAPAMALTELRRRIHERRPGRAPSSTNLRVLLENCPDRFRVIDPWGRPWRARQEETAEDASDVLVMTITPGSFNDGCLSAGERMRESVRWIARSVDMRSPGSVARLYALLLEESGTRRRLTRRAA